MFYLQAPYPLLRTTTVLPDPQFSDQESITDIIKQKRAMDGTRYVYVKRRASRRKLHWTFNLTRNKGLELRAFIQSYFASKVKVIDHAGQAWLGNFTIDPFEYDTPERAAPAIAPMPRGEMQTITIELEGVKL
jgi:hypothetical protein